MPLLFKQASPQCNYKSHLCLRDPGGIRVFCEKKEDLFLMDVSSSPSQMVWPPRAWGCSTFSGVSCRHCQSWPRKRCHRSVYPCYQCSRERDPPKWKTPLHHQSGGQESPQLAKCSKCTTAWLKHQQSSVKSAGKWRRTRKSHIYRPELFITSLGWFCGTPSFQNPQ